MKMDFIYTTDLHGDVRKYDSLLKTAIDQKIELIHLGADLLPKGSDILSNQKKFINGYLKNFYSECKNKGIDVLAFFGNDDIYSRKKYFLKYASLLDEKSFTKDGYEFKAYPFVQDYPFGLKTACKLDYPGWSCPEPYISQPVDCGPNGNLETIQENIDQYFNKKGTIKEDLDHIKVNNKTVMAIHQPPWSVSLDVCLDGRRVGSKSIYDWIVKKQPLMVLCGHIHESYYVTKTWKTNIGSTLVIQPGQCFDNRIRMIYISVNEEGIRSELFEV